MLWVSIEFSLNSKLFHNVYHHIRVRPKDKWKTSSEMIGCKKKWVVLQFWVIEICGCIFSAFKAKKKSNNLSRVQQSKVQKKKSTKPKKSNYYANKTESRKKKELTQKYVYPPYNIDFPCRQMKWNEKDKLTEEEETAKSASHGGINEATNAQIQACIPLGIEVKLCCWWDLFVFFSHRMEDLRCCIYLISFLLETELISWWEEFCMNRETHQAPASVDGGKALLFWARASAQIWAGRPSRMVISLRSFPKDDLYPQQFFDTILVLFIFFRKKQNKFWNLYNFFLNISKIIMSFWYYKIGSIETLTLILLIILFKILYLTP